MGKAVLVDFFQVAVPKMAVERERRFPHLIAEFEDGVFHATAVQDERCLSTSTLKSARLPQIVVLLNRPRPRRSVLAPPAHDCGHPRPIFCGS